MSEAIIIPVILIVGILLGIFFFGGLWWTTKRGLVSKYPALWFLGSLLIRIGITVTMFYFISRDHWERALFCLVGFIIARSIILRFTQVPDITQNN